MIVFAVVSAGIVWISRASLSHIRSHGFYRFLSWEAILSLILLNIDYWFKNLFSFNQMIATLLLTISFFWVIYGVWWLRIAGKPDTKRDDPSLLGIEKTTELVTTGAYRYIRHPLYSSLVFLACGTFFKHPSWAGFFLTAAAMFFLMMTAKMEEAENLRFFGPAYRLYMKKTKMFIPFLF